MSNITEKEIIAGLKKAEKSLIKEVITNNDGKYSVFTVSEFKRKLEKLEKESTNK